MNELFPDFSVNLYFPASLALSFLRAKWVNSINQVIVLRLQYTNSQGLGAMRPSFGPVYKCLFSMAPDEAKPMRTVSLNTDQCAEPVQPAHSLLSQNIDEFLPAFSVICQSHMEQM